LPSSSEADNDDDDLSLLLHLKSVAHYADKVKVPSELDFEKAAFSMLCEADYADGMVFSNSEHLSYGLAL
jgi:hypothetical protein